MTELSVQRIRSRCFLIWNCCDHHLNIPKRKSARNECACYLANDIGAYNTCGHLCRYCYANANEEAVRQNMRRHNPYSPFLTGEALPQDQVHEAEQKSWADHQMSLF